MARARRALPRMILERRWPASQADRLRIVDACAERLLEAYDEIDELRAELRRLLPSSPPPRPRRPSPRPRWSSPRPRPRRPSSPPPLSPPRQPFTLGT